MGIDTTSAWGDSLGHRPVGDSAPHRLGAPAWARPRGPAWALACAAWVAIAAAPAPAAASHADVAPAVFALPSVPGSPRGLADEASLDVHTGQAHLAVPLALPAAAAGMRPHLQLTYNGALGNGPLGVGWTLSLPTLARSLRRGVPQYGAADDIDLVIPGATGRLFRVREGTWHVEGAGRRVRVRGSAGAGFVVEDGGGRTYTFGRRVRRADGEHVAAWCVEQIEDGADQRIDYGYADAADGPRLTYICWGEGKLRVELDYEARPDVTTSYRAGFAQTSDHRLHAIRVCSHGALLRRYALV